MARLLVFLLVFQALCGAALSGCATTSVTPVPGQDLGAASDGGSIPAGALTISPNPITVTAGATPQSIALTVTSSTDGLVTSQVSFVLSDPTLGTLDNGQLTVAAGLSRGARATLTASYGPQKGTAAVVIRVVAPDLKDGLSPNTPGPYFTGGDGGALPAWGYPLSGALLPPNITRMNLQWTGTAGGMVYRVHLECPTFAQDLYLGPAVCKSTVCQYEPDRTRWSNFAYSCLGTDATLTLTASPGPGQKTGSDGPLKLTFAPEDLQGGLYYFNTAVLGLYRMPAGAGEPILYQNRGLTFGCGGCHAVSRDGRQVAVPLQDTYRFDGGFGAIVDGKNGARYLLQPPAIGNFDFPSFSPKGDMLLVNSQGKLWIVDTQRGDTLYTVPAVLSNNRLAQGEWSPDGQSIALVRTSAPIYKDYELINAGDIVVMPFNNGQFGLPDVIVPAIAGSEYHFYPSWTPDGKWLLFNTARPVGGADVDSHHATDTLLRMVRAQVGAKPISLLNARRTANASTNWPRAVPIPQRSGSLLFFSFSSRAPYGLIKPGASAQLWLSTVDLDKAQAQPTQDPSSVPFWLPGQDMVSDNLMGSWTANIACSLKTDCPAGYDCVGEKCVPLLQ